MITRFSSLALFAGVLASTSVRAQGVDDCASPQAISGVGVFAFDTTSATTGASAQNFGTCTDTAGLTGIANDVWFAWTAPSTDEFDLATCGGTAIDSKVAVHGSVGCPTLEPLACNDDACGTQSQLRFSATGGATYAIQLGNWPGPNTLPGTGTFSISIFVPPPPCSPSVGPDVIVGDIQDISNVSVSGPLDAISLGTTSCNIGTVNLNWFANVNQHPVIGGNLYRYRTVNGSGRFEQIGMSWLKHGFFALSLELCCTNCQGTDGSTLGVNCSDPYTAARNGQQFGLGPRFEVNPHTGAYPFPPSSPAFSGSTARRCEFLTSDVDVSPGVRYFGETQYVTPDDAAAGNQDNNASYRELSAVILGGAAGAQFGFVGATQREKSAIEAWSVVDPAVVVNAVAVPGEGLFHVGYRATDLGGGQYHYEYAVHNLNSDRAGGSFTVSVPASATVTNVEFHDVEYRNGDGDGSASFSGLDWTVTRSGDTLTWTCETPSQNALANALRWGTTYNFRFDANAAPTPGLATLGLWKSGAPANVTTSVDVPGGSPIAGFCFGDGSSGPCPCGNESAAGAGQGCAHSGGQGSRLVATGATSVSADALVLQVDGLPVPSTPPGVSLFFQGTTPTNVAFADGRLCVGGTLVRLAVKHYSGGTAVYPSVGDASVSVRGSLTPAGGVRYYQVWHRDLLTPCGSNSNLSNAVNVTWLP